MYCISFLESVLHCHMLIIDGQIILPCEVKSLYKHCLYKVVSSPPHKILFILFIYCNSKVDIWHVHGDSFMNICSEVKT